MIRIQGLHKFYNKGKQNELHVINDVSLDLPDKGMVAIFGKSGCGKTTLLNVIGGLDRFSDGSLTIEHNDIRKNTDELRNQYVGYIFQNYNLNKTESCFDNVADALRLCGMTDAGEIESRVMAALAGVGLEKYAKRTPDTLSGGQQQRIAIARAIVKNPRIILADEPTGNLDEANTVMIMDLLKEIAKDHLVLLVTHEENLVDFYCDQVIEVQDGKVTSIRENQSADGFSARDKNDIFLGELEKREISSESAEIEYYGELPTAPIKLKIVNNGGKLYVQIGTEKVQILDESSEIKLREGVYKERKAENERRESFDMSRLPPVEGTKFGRLFSFKSSVKSGYIANFRGGKKKKNALRGCLCLFSSVIVLMSAIFGSAFRDLIDAKNAYNHNVFYITAQDAAVSAKLNAAVSDANTGIDFVRLAPYLQEGDETVQFRTGTFETFEFYSYSSDFSTNAAILDTTLAKDMKLLAGKKTDLTNHEILISSKVADALLEKSFLGYIDEYRDLIGLISDSVSLRVGNAYLRIAGIVDCDESAVFLTERTLAARVHEQTEGLASVELASEYDIAVAEGEAILVIRYLSDDIAYPKAGETVKIQGRDIKVTSVRISYSDYEEFLKMNGYALMEQSEFFAAITEEENPHLDKGSAEFAQAHAQVSKTHYYDYFDYYYSHFDKYLEDVYFFHPDSSLDLWLYMEKGIEIAKYTYFASDYYKAICFKAQYGRFPTTEELDERYNDFPDANEALEPYRALFSQEYYNTEANAYQSLGAASYMVHVSDYIAFSKQVGETHPSAKGGYYSYIKDVVFDGGAPTDDSGYTYYTMIHSSDPAKTAAWLESEVLPLIDADGYVSPAIVLDNILRNYATDIVSELLTLVLLLVIMSICMYFIMRASLLSRIKEVGIYRAIGVSKKNLVFKFFIESIVLTALTVLIGYLVTSGFILACFSMSSLMAEVFFYPLWLAGADLFILALISLFFGTLPILSLLRSTPSEILAKYDI